MDRDSNRYDIRGARHSVTFDAGGQGVTVLLDKSTGHIGLVREGDDPDIQACMSGAVGALAALYLADPDDADAVAAARERARVVLERHAPAAVSEHAEPGLWERELPGTLDMLAWPVVDLEQQDVGPVCAALRRAQAERVDGPTREASTARGAEGEPDKFTVPQMRAVLATLGMDLDRSPAPKLTDLPYLVGCLLAFAEVAVSVEGAEAGDSEDDTHGPTTEGYVQTVLGVTGGQLPAAARLWAEVMEERLWRTMVHLSLNQVSDAGGQLYAEVMGCSIMVASNLAQAVNRPLTHGDIREGVNAARYDTRALTERLAALIAFERARGVDIPETIQDMDSLMEPPTD